MRTPCPTVGPLPALLALLAAAPLLGAEPSTAKGQALSFPPYDSVPGLAQYASREAYTTAAADRRFVMEQIRYPSDGLTVLAYVYRPVASSGRLPVVVFNRGSWTWESFHPQLLVMAHRLAEAGYVVVAPMYRGSGGAPARDEMGGAELDDLLNLRPVLATFPGVNPARVYLYGESRGGMMVYQALWSGFPVRAAAVFGAFTDLEGMLAEPKGLEMARKIWPQELEKDRAARRAEVGAALAGADLGAGLHHARGRRPVVPARAVAEDGRGAPGRRKAVRAEGLLRRGARSVGPCGRARPGRSPLVPSLSLIGARRPPMCRRAHRSGQIHDDAVRSRG